MPAAQRALGLTMKYVCSATGCGAITNTPRCPQHTGNPATGSRNPTRDLPAQQRFARAVKRRDGYRCARCGTTQDLRACHIIPLHQGGTYEPSNGVTLCRQHDKDTDLYAR